MEDYLKKLISDPSVNYVFNFDDYYANFTYHIPERINQILNENLFLIPLLYESYPIIEKHFHRKIQVALTLFDLDLREQTKDAIALKIGYPSYWHRQYRNCCQDAFQDEWELKEDSIFKRTKGKLYISGSGGTGYPNKPRKFLSLTNEHQNQCEWSEKGNLITEESLKYDRDWEVGIKTKYSNQYLRHKSYMNMPNRSNVSVSIRN